jgi:hypothetical protein
LSRTSPICAAVIPATACGRGWAPCLRPRQPGTLLCSKHHDALLGAILGFHNLATLPEFPSVNAQKAKRYHAKKAKLRRSRAAQKSQTRSQENPSLLEPAS